MNEVMHTILTRRSIREFANKQIPVDTLNNILKAALYAPSGMNQQTWNFTAVCSREKIQKLADAVGKELNRENYDFYNPAVLILPSNERESIWGKEDNACALQNIFLAAHSFGIGSVWINQLQNICDKPAIRNILDEFEIPKQHIIYGAAALGYPAQQSKTEVQKTGKIHMIE